MGKSVHTTIEMVIRDDCYIRIQNAEDRDEFIDIPFELGPKIASFLWDATAKICKHVGREIPDP
jgi:hypothetical protein